jgi:hypothetical protein
LAMHARMHVVIVCRPWHVCVRVLHCMSCVSVNSIQWPQEWKSKFIRRFLAIETHDRDINAVDYFSGQRFYLPEPLFSSIRATEGKISANTMNAVWPRTRILKEQQRWRSL